MYVLKIQNIRQGQPCCFVRLPPIRQVDDVSKIKWNDPSIVKVFIHNLTHRTFGFMKHIDSHKKNNPDHWSLISQCKWSVFCLGICRHLLINIIILYCNYDGLYNLLVDWKKLKKLLRIVWWPGCFGAILLFYSKSSIRTKSSYFINSINIFSTFVSIIAYNKPFSHFSLDEPIH